MNGRTMTIVGVAPREFRGTAVGPRPSFFAPITIKFPNDAGLLAQLLFPKHTSRDLYWVHLLGRLKPGVTRETATAAINPLYGGILRDVEAPLLLNVDEQQREAFGQLSTSLVMALLLVYMVLACQYESLRDPLVVMLSVPVAATGVLLTLFLTGTTLNVQSYIGCIMLGGIVVNNAILLVDQAGRLRLEDGMTTAAALTEAGRRRLRPILMTTLTTILGLLPLALGIGEGADAQAPLARAVVGGLTGSTLITLVLIPAIYSLIHKEKAPQT